MPWGGPDPRDASVASDTSTRVGDGLERAEARAREIREQADRSAAELRRAARHEAEGIAKEARRAAEAAAHRRVQEISELRASIAARAGSLVEGLEGGELTAARLAELVAALGDAAERVMAEVSNAAATPDSPTVVTVAGNGAEPAPDAPPPGLFERTEAASANGEPAAARPEPSRPRPDPIVDPLPEGAPIAKRPRRGSSARYTAVVMAIQGSDRDEVAARLAEKHGIEDAEELLDDVFGRADARA
jgi:hypothetical protein